MTHYVLLTSLFHPQSYDYFSDTLLAYKPSLINDSGYLSKHPELATFFQAHPDIKDAMEENPGNFAAIPPRPGE